LICDTVYRQVVDLQKVRSKNYSVILLQPFCRVTSVFYVFIYYIGNIVCFVYYKNAEVKNSHSTGWHVLQILLKSLENLFLLVIIHGLLGIYKYIILFFMIFGDFSLYLKCFCLIFYRTSTFELMTNLLSVCNDFRQEKFLNFCEKLRCWAGNREPT